jgi:hypothetical protein
MGAFFFIGPVGAVLGLGLGAWLLWQLAADPARHGIIGMSLGGGLLVLLIGGAIAFSPRYEPGIAWPKGMKGQAQVEVRLPVSVLGDMKRDALAFDLRCGGGTLQTTWDPKQLRREGDRAVVPAAFTLHDRQTGWIFAVMQRDKQLATHDIDLKEPLTETSEWTAWQPMDGGMEMRYRTAVVPGR